jgi:hypothetical protein
VQILDSNEYDIKKQRESEWAEKRINLILDLLEDKIQGINQQIDVYGKTMLSFAANIVVWNTTKKLKSDSSKWLFRGGRLLSNIQSNNYRTSTRRNLS